METILISKCCGAEVRKLIEADTYAECGYLCQKCMKSTDNVEEVCAECLGTGEVVVDEAVYADAGSPTAPIGHRKCFCRKINQSQGY